MPNRDANRAAFPELAALVDRLPGAKVLGACRVEPDGSLRVLGKPSAWCRRVARATGVRS